MELKVSVDGVERSISGVSNETTCAQIIYALAHAISQKGRFVMIEKYRNKERRLSPIDKPLELLEKWREHMSNVTFVLKKIDDEDDNSLPSNGTPRTYGFQMELKVSVDGVERSISGVSNETTCAQIIYALAHAISQKGRFVMIEKYRNKERRLSPIDKPLELLEKWREHMSNVTFVLKKIDDEDDNSLPSNGTPQKGTDFSSSASTISAFQSVSSSSMPTAMPSGKPIVIPQNMSTTSLPTIPLRSTERFRPPPPDYNSVMEQKFASLGRGIHPHPPISMLQDDDMSIARMGLSQNDLLVLIEKQRQLIERQRENLLNAELTLPSDADREFLQLQRQQENLRNILAPMRESNWPQQYQKQLKQSHKLRAAIEATKEAIDKTASDIENIRLREQELQKRLTELNESTTAPQRTAASLPIGSSSSSPKLKAC
ncbi:Ras association domain protein [Ostertagia ostertagi]